MSELRLFELGFKGTELRQKLVDAVLRGEKTGTACLLGEEPMPVVGVRSLLVDIDDRPIGIVETTEVRVMRIGECDLAFAISEGEGFTSVAEWREAHVEYWSAYWPEPITDDTMFVAERFRIVELFPARA
ncbi:MAG: ASCH domain-containing protein [Kofleriaceae bacterium]